LIRTGRVKFAWITGMPLAWLAIITSTAAFQKIFSEDIRIGFLAGANAMTEKVNSGIISEEKINIMNQLIFNLRFDAVITAILTIVLWLVIFDVLKLLLNKKYKQSGLEN
jgi:carbon starvation protein